MARRETAYPALTDEQAAALAGVLLDDRSYDRVIREDADLYTQAGDPLLVFRRNALSLASCEAAYPALRNAATATDNRGYAGGGFDQGNGLADVRNPGKVAATTAVRFKERKSDGTLSRVGRAKLVDSGIVGYFDRSARYPYCRLTAFNLAHPARFAAALPFVREVDAVFARELPARYAAQKAVVERTSPDFYIHGTVFTTVTVNRNWQTAVHQDKGDLKEGFGVLAAFSGGHYAGGLFVLPKYRVAVDLRTRDVLLVDVHEWHGNTPIVGTPGGYERVSCVFYYRENMRYCGTAEQEAEFAKNRPPGSQILKADPRAPRGEGAGG